MLSSWCEIEKHEICSGKFVNLSKDICLCLCECHKNKDFISVSNDPQKPESKLITI